MYDACMVRYVDLIPKANLVGEKKTARNDVEALRAKVNIRQQYTDMGCTGF